MRHPFSCSIALMILAVLVSSTPVQSQSTTGCAAQQRSQMSGITNDADLKNLAEQTGGGATFPKNKEALETALSQITNRLRANYVIGYCSESKGKLEVEVTDPEMRKTKPFLAYKRR